VTDLHDQHHVGWLDAVDDAGVGELGFDGAADLAFGGLRECSDVIGDDALQILDAMGRSQASS